MMPGVPERRTTATSGTARRHCSPRSTSHRLRDRQMLQAPSGDRLASRRNQRPLLLARPDPAPFKTRDHRHLTHRTVANTGANTVACTSATSADHLHTARRSLPEDTFDCPPRHALGIGLAQVSSIKTRRAGSGRPLCSSTAGADARLSAGSTPS